MTAIASSLTARFTFVQLVLMVLIATALTAVAGLTIEHLFTDAAAAQPLASGRCYRC
jgi:hypothetical protein